MGAKQVLNVWYMCYWFRQPSPSSTGFLTGHDNESGLALNTCFRHELLGPLSDSCSQRVLAALLTLAVM